MAMNEVYVVTTGEYSDYGILAVFADKDQAEKVAEDMNRINRYAGASVEVWGLYGPQDTSRVAPIFYGNWSSRPQPVITYDERGWPRLMNKELVVAEPAVGGGTYGELTDKPVGYTDVTLREVGDGHVLVTVSGDNRERVEKVLRDTVAKWRAENEIEPKAEE